MKTRVYIFILVSIWVVSFAFGYENTIKRSFPLTPEGSVRLETIRGDINISTHSENEIKIEAIVSSGDSNEPDKVELQFEANADSIIISSPLDIGLLTANIEFFLKVPENLKSLYLSTLGGKIKSRGTYRNIDFKTTNGEIDVRGEFSEGNLTSANGDIEVNIKDILKGNISAESTNGSIKITMKPGSGFIVEGHTVTGYIRNEYDASVTSDLLGSGIKGTIKDGTYKLCLETVNGNIQLLGQ